MTKRFYLDSNVLISYIREEFGKGFKLMFERTREFLALCTAREHILVLSDLTLEETKSKTFCSSQELIDLLIELGVKLELIHLEKDKVATHKLVKARKIHFPDSLHAAIAIDSKCNAIITWNKKDFQKITDLIEVLSPEDFA